MNGIRVNTADSMMGARSEDVDDPWLVFTCQVVFHIIIRGLGCEYMPDLVVIFCYDGKYVWPTETNQNICTLLITPEDHQGNMDCLLKCISMAERSLEEGDCLIRLAGGILRHQSLQCAPPLSQLKKVTY